MNDTCPTCGQQVRVHQSSEGTGCFVPVESEVIKKHRDKGNAQYSNLFVWCVENLQGFPPIEGEWIDDVKARLMRSESPPSEEKILAASFDKWWPTSGTANVPLALGEQFRAGLKMAAWEGYKSGWKDRGGE